MMTGDETKKLHLPTSDSRNLIAGYTVPRELHLVPSMLCSPSGKPDYPRAREFAIDGKHKV